MTQTVFRTALDGMPLTDPQNGCPGHIRHVVSQDMHRTGNAIADVDWDDGRRERRRVTQQQILAVAGWEWK